MSWQTRSEAAHLAAGLVGVTAVTFVLGSWLRVSNATIVSISYLLVVLLVAATSRLRVAVATSVAAMLALNFFFLPPVGTFTIAEPHNWVALVAFLTVSLVASNLSAVARARTEEALNRRDEVARLFDLSRDVFMVTESREALAALSRSIARRFDLDYVAVALPEGAGWRVHDAGTRRHALDPRQFANVFAAAQTTLEFDAYSRSYSGHKTIDVDGQRVHLVPLRVGTKPIGVLAAAGRPVEAGTLDALAGVVAIGIERVQLIEERKTAELTRQSEQLKTALLASLSHDLRTPLTAIRIAASNIKAGGLGRGEEIEQADLVLSEVERLTRLFQNLLDMARIDAGAVTTESRWTHPSEIVAAAREQVEHALHGYHVEVAIDPDVPVRVDPRLTATALSHVIENAAHYSTPGAVVRIEASAGADGLTIAVRDHGPGIGPADMPRLFERFYRGAAGGTHTSGTGMGLWIVRGLLAVEGGRVWAENCADGGARFTIVVPGQVQQREFAAAPPA